MKQNIKKYRVAVMSGVFLISLFLINFPIQSISSKTLATYQGYLWYGLDYSGHVVVRNGDHKPVHVVSHFLTNQISFDYGIYPKINIAFFLKIPYTHHEGDNDFNFGDGRMTIKYEILEQHEDSTIPGLAVFSAVQAPLSNYSPYKENAIGERHIEFEFGLILDYTWEFPLLPLSIAFAPGYRLRITPGPDQIFLEFEIGTEINSHLGLKLKSYVHYSLTGIDYRGEEYHRVQSETGHEPIPQLRSIFSNLVAELEYHVGSKTTLGFDIGYIVYVVNAPELYRIGLSCGRLF